MTIDVQADFRLVSQAEFASVVYEAMAVFFEVHNDLGRLFGEKVYKKEVQMEVPIDVSFESYRKRYYLDMLVSGCVPFEIKARRNLAPEHRAQLRRFLNHTRLEAMHWVNITRRALTFRTLKRGSS